MDNFKEQADATSTDVATAEPTIKKEDVAEDEISEHEQDTKGLSSKEKRQLRNKVSARAFRSRRKEYIGQLESEVEQKEKEVAELNTRNKELTEENRRLLNTTKKMLSSSAFKGFLAEASKAQKAQKQQDQQTTKQEIDAIA